MKPLKKKKRPENEQEKTVEEIKVVEKGVVNEAKRAKLLPEEELQVEPVTIPLVSENKEPLDTMMNKQINQVLSM